MERTKELKKPLGVGLVLLALLSLIGADARAAGMRIDHGSMVHLNYFLEANGVAIIPEQKRENVELIVGKGAYPPDFEKQLIGLRKGDAKNIELTPDQAYGPHLSQLVKRVSKKEFPPSIPLKEGLLLGTKDGRHPIRIAKILDDSVVMDENHPLAGKTLLYHVQVTDVG